MTGERSGYEYFEVEADVGVAAWAPTLAEAFALAALGSLGLVVAPAGVQALEAREARAQAETPEALLVNWVNECLYVQEIEGFAVHSVTMTRLDAGVAHGFLQGEPIDPARHRLGTVVKAATLHRVEVEDGPERARVRLIVDV